MQSSYRQFPQNAPQRSPHTNPGRRGIGPIAGGPPVPPQSNITPQQMEAQRLAKAQAESILRHSKVPVDRNLPDGIDECIIGDGAQRCRDLQDVERRLDAIMARKRLDMQDGMSRNNTQRYGTMRIWISNTVEDQPWQADSLDADAFDFSSNMDSSYRVKIEGRLLEDPTDLDLSDDSDDEAETGDAMQEDSKAKAKNLKPKKQTKLSYFFKSMTVDFEGKRAKDGSEQSVEWKRPNVNVNAKNIPDAADFDVLEFKRGGDENTNITINFVRSETPERFQLSPELAEIVDTTVATRAEVVMRIWQYVKAMGLQEDDEKRSFKCDDLLKKVLNRDTGYIPYLADQVFPHMSTLAPVKLPYTIRMDQEFHRSPTPTIYDVQVLLDDPLRLAFQSAYMASNFPTMLQDVNKLNSDIAYHMQALTISKSKHAFLAAISKDPANFIRKWMSSQQRDLDIISGGSARGGLGESTGEEWRRGGPGSVWQSENVRESVNLLLTRPR